jgi:hypothetical protein
VQLDGSTSGVMVRIGSWDRGSWEVIGGEVPRFEKSPRQKLYKQNWFSGELLVHWLRGSAAGRDGKTRSKTGQLYLDHSFWLNDANKILGTGDGGRLLVSLSRGSRHHLYKQNCSFS